MKTRILLLPIILATLAGTLPASSQVAYRVPSVQYQSPYKPYVAPAPGQYMTRYDRWRASLEPATGHELNKFIGTTLKGKAHMPLGIVAAADRTTGSVGVVGRHGEVAQIHNSLLYRDGAVLRAPDLTYGDIARASAHRRPLVRPEIIIEEIPAR